MDKEFKVRIVDFYKDVDKPIINNIFDDKEGKQVLELSTKTEFNLLKKDKNKWILKDKRKILKEIDLVKKRKVKEYTTKINQLNKDNTNLDTLKLANIKIISELENIESLKKNIDDEELYKKLVKLASFNHSENFLKNNQEINIQKITSIAKLPKRGGGSFVKEFKENKNLSDISQLSSETDNFIEVFSN